MKLIRKMKALLRRQEWLRRAAHRLHLRTQSRWLYHRDVVAWTTLPQYRSQLPPLYRLFARYCGAWIAAVPSASVWGARLVLSVVMRVQHRLAPCYSERFVSSSGVFYLDLHDARFLAAGKEMITGDIERLLARFLHEGDTFVDVGANHGAFALAAARLVDHTGRVVAIEPQPRLAQNVERSLRECAPCRFEVHQRAVGDASGSAVFLVPRSYSGTAGLYAEHSGLDSHDEIVVEMIVFDDAVDWPAFPGSVFVKLDIEGAELRFLEGARRMLEARRPAVLMEVNPASLEAAGVRLEALLELLTSCGYDCYYDVMDLDALRRLSELRADALRNVVVFSSGRA